MDRAYYEPYIKPGYLRQLNRVFQFNFLKESYVPLMKLIIRYISCEGRFSRLYAYHIWLLMHFTRVWMMNIPYFMCHNIERMIVLVQKKTPKQKHNSIYHYALIKIVVVHQLRLHGIAWEDFISHDFLTSSQPPPETFHDASEPSHQF